MMLTRSSSHGTGRAGRSVVVAAALAVVASFAAPSAASAAGSGAAGNKAGTGRTAPAHHARPADGAHGPKPIVKTATAKPSTKPANPYGKIARPSFTKPTYVRPARPAAPAARVRPTVKLWRGTPSYTVPAETNTSASPNLTFTAACTKSGNITAPFTWSPATCPNGYEIAADATVPSTKTLTINPGTVVYVDTTVGGAPLSGDPSDHVDLKVNGTLKVLGTAANPVTLTSLNATPDSSIEPQAGDWGYVFFNHVGGQLGGGTLDHLRLLYGQGVAADRSRPAITNSVISNVAGGTNAVQQPSITESRGIDYENVTSGTVTFSNLTYDGAATSGILVQSVYDHGSFDGSNKSGNRFIFVLKNSHITGGAPSVDTIYVASAVNGASASVNNAGVKIMVTGNHITNTANEYALDASIYTPSVSVPGTAYVTGAVTGNTITGGSSSYGLYFDVETYDSKKAGTTTCTGVSACVLLPFQRNRITVYGEAVYTYVWVHAGTGHALVNTPYGKKTKKSVIPGGRYESDDNDTIENDVYNYGTGNAVATIPFIATTNNSYDIGLYSYVEAYQGNATNVASVTGSTWVSYDEYNVEQDTYGSNNAAPPTGVAGAATSRATVTNSTFTAYDYNLYTDSTQSKYGPASNSQHISGSTLTSNDDWNIYNYVYGSQTGGSGGANNLVDIRNSTVNSYDGVVHNDDVYAYNGNAPATSTVNLVNSKAWAYDDNVIDNYAYAAQNAASHGTATANVNVTGSKVISYYDGIYNYASSNYGGAAGSPRIVNSELTSTDDYAIENYIYGTNNGGSHSATGSPFIKGSTINTYYTTIYNDVYTYYGAGSAIGNPYIQNSTVAVGDDDAIYNYVQSPNQTGGGGNATANPRILGSNVTAYYYLIDNEATSDFGIGTANPVIRGSTVISGDDYGIYNYAYGSQTSGTGAAVANPVIDASNVHTYEYVIYNEASSEGGPSTANPVINKSTVVAADDEVIYNYSYASNSTGQSKATGSPRIVDSKVHAYYDLIENYVYGERGAAVGNPVILRTKGIATDDYAIYNYVYADYALVTSGHSATANPVINASTIVSYSDAIENFAYGYRGSATANPSILASNVTVSDDYGIDNYAAADYNDTTAGHTATASPHIVGSVVNAYYYDIYNYAYGYQGPAVANPLIKTSTVSSNDDYGIYNNAYGSYSSGSGSATANPVVNKSSITSYDDDVYNYAETKQGKTVTNPQILGSRLKTLFGYVLYNEGYAGNTGGTAPAIGNPVFRSSTGVASGSSDTALYNYQYSYFGTATANPTVAGSRLVSADSGYGIENYAYSSQSGNSGAAVAHPVVTASKITSYEDALYNYASAGTGNSGADGSFNVTDSRLVSLEYVGVDSEAHSAGTALSKVIPTVTNTVIRSPDDDAIDLYAKPAGTGPAHIGGTITGSTLTGEGDMVYANASATGGASIFDTLIKTSTLVSTDNDGIYANYSVNGNASTIAPTVLDSHIVAVADYGMDLEATGWANTGNTLKVAPVVKRTSMNTENGVYLYASDNNNATQPGRSLVSGSISDGKIVSTQYYGVYAEARCDYCTDSSRAAITVTNTPINSLDEALYQYAYSTANSGSAPASIGGGLVSTKRSGVTVNDAYGAYGEADSRTGNVSSTFHVTGLALTTYHGPIYHYLTSATGTATSNAVLSNNVLTPFATGSYDAIYDEAAASTTATMNDTINRNVIADFGNSSNNGIDVYVNGATNVAALAIAHNTVVNVGGLGIEAYTRSGAPATGSVTVDHNTVARTGYSGFWFYGLKPIITGNVQSSANHQSGTGNNLDGFYVELAPAGGSMTCNVISNDARGIEFSGNTGNPVVHQNSFVPLASNVRNSVDIKSDSSTNATNNFFHGNPRKAGAGPINTTPKLSAIPNCAKSAGA